MLRLRLARPQDAAGVARVHVRSWQVGYRGLLPDAYLDGLRPEDRAARYTFGSADPNAPQTVVALEDDAVVGFATIVAAQADDVSGAGELVALYVDPAAWGHGVGARLIADARQRLSRCGFNEAILWVIAGNERAQRFYRTDGWSCDDVRRSREVWGVAIDEVRYRHRLM